MSAPPAVANVFDTKYLTELSFKTIIESLARIKCFITGDNDYHEHPCCLVRASENLERFPGTGIFRHRVELELQLKLDDETAESSQATVARLRQALYRNDTDPRPFVDLANRLTNAQASPYTCLGLISVDEPPTAQDSQVRLYIYKLVFRVEATPTR